MSGAVGTPSQDTRFDKNSVCIGSRRHSGRSDTRDTDSNRYRGLKMPHKERLEMIGRWVRTQDSIRILYVVHVEGILGVPIQEIPIRRDTND